MYILAYALLAVIILLVITLIVVMVLNIETENSRKNYTNWNNRRNSISMYDCYLDQFS